MKLFLTRVREKLNDFDEALLQAADFFAGCRGGVLSALWFAVMIGLAALSAPIFQLNSVRIMTEGTSYTLLTVRPSTLSIVFVVLAFAPFVLALLYATCLAIGEGLAWVFRNMPPLFTVERTEKTYSSEVTVTTESDEHFVEPRRPMNCTPPSVLPNINNRVGSVE